MIASGGVITYLGGGQSYELPIDLPESKEQFSLEFSEARFLFGEQEVGAVYDSFGGYLNAKTLLKARKDYHKLNQATLV